MQTMEFDTAEQRSEYFSGLASLAHQRRKEKDQEAAQLLARLLRENQDDLDENQVARAHLIIRKGCKDYRPELDG